MNKMMVAVFDTESAAYEGLHALKELHREGDITLYATAVLTKDFAGIVSVQQTADRGPLGTALGVLMEAWSDWRQVEPGQPPGSQPAAWPARSGRPWGSRWAVWPA